MTEQQITIEEGIEPPPNVPRRVTKYPFDVLEVNQSFFIPVDEVEGVPYEKVRSARQSVLHSCGVRSTQRTGFKFITRRWEQDGVRGIRVWRIE